MLFRWFQPNSQLLDFHLNKGNAKHLYCVTGADDVLFHSEKAGFAILKHLFVVFLNAQNECNSSHNECYQWFFINFTHCKTSENPPQPNAQTFCILF